MRCLALIALGTLLGTLAAEPLPLVVNGAGESVFGDVRLQVTFDAATASPRLLTTDGETLLASDAEAPAPVTIDRWNPWSERNRIQPVKGLGVTRVSDDTVCGSLLYGKWRLDGFLQLRPDKLAVRRWYAFTWTGTNRVEFSNLWLSFGLAPCAPGKGLYHFPWAFPPVRYTRGDGRSQVARNSESGEAPTIAEMGTGWSALVAWDSLQPYSDHGQTGVIEREGGLSLFARTTMRGYAHPGKTQKAGDAWIVFRRGDAAEALAHMHDWHRLVGHLPPAGRPDSVKSITLYATHPKGRGMSEPGGFPHAQEYLPFIAALGINTIWMRPVEHKSGYCPDEMYELQEGVGTPADHLAYVRDAHARGLKVWRDAVMHGGKSDNRRSKEHPEWVCLKQDGTQADSYWAYDFFWPTWVKYFADYVEWTTRRYEIDGWRMDVPTGSRFPNWNPAIPYDRASYAQNQGGLAQMRSIRAAARRANPNAVTLAEANASPCSVTCDTIHDQLLCHGYFHWFNDHPAEEVIGYLRRWLDDQRKSFVPGTVWMRYPESHDAFPCDAVWGRAGANALFALCAWMEGFPLVMNESEDGAFEAYRRILAIRRTLRELNDGTPDYLSEQAPPGVFACRRDNGETASVFYVNFNGFRVQAGGFDLPPFGYAIRRVKGPSVEEALGQGLERPFAPNRAPGPDAVVAEVRDATNGLVTAGVRIARTETAEGVRFRVADWGGRDPKHLRLVLRLPAVGRWFAHAAEGSFESPYLVRHPNIDRYHRHGEWFDGAVVWDSRYHPFGLTREHATVGGVDGETAWECFGFDPRATVRLWNRLAREPCFAVSVSGDKAAAFDVTCRRTSAAAALAPRDAGTGDPRLRAAMGGWVYETPKMRLRIRRTGAVAGLWKKEADGSWRPVLNAFGVQGRAPTAPKRIRQAWGGRDRDAKEQAFAPFPKAWFARTPDGGLRLTFDSGEVRGIEQNSGGMPHHVRAFAGYDLKDDDAFGLTLGFTSSGLFGKDDWTLEMLAVFPAGEKSDAVTLSPPAYDGWGPERIVREGTRLHYIYHAPEGEDFSSPRNWRQSLTTRIGLAPFTASR